MPYFYGLLAYLMTSLCGSIPTISHQPDKMDASTGNKGRQAIGVSTPNLAHINLETARREGNVPMESGTSSQGETGAGQQGKAVNQRFDTIVGSRRFRNTWHERQLTHTKSNGCVFHATQSNHRNCWFYIPRICAGI